MNDSVVILGRQPALGLAELESLYGSKTVAQIGSTAARVSVDPCLLAFDRLGGAMKFCRPLTTLPSTDWKQIEKFLIEVSPGHSERMPEGKMHLGLSTIGFPEVSLQRLMATGLTVKKAIRKQTGRTVRLVPNKEPELNTAQVIHNKLVTPNGWELIFIRDGNSTVIAQTIKVQDIESYTRRDRERPKRDTRVGMLPPKLAQIIINLAVGALPADTLKNICDIPAGQEVNIPDLDKTVLDPFCGTGVVLQEALLMGYRAYGTDLDERMVRYSRDNINWIMDERHFKNEWQAERGDATNYTWSPIFDFVACESYLGRPFTSVPAPDVLAQTVSDCNLIIKKFLRNIHPQLQPGTRLCVAVPAWQVQDGQFKHLPLIDSLGEIGYNRVSFEHVRSEELLYYRENQVVARELLVLIRK